jgi:hypothetical protein
LDKQKLADGKVRPSCEDEPAFEGERLIVSCDDNAIPESFKAA